MQRIRDDLNIFSPEVSKFVFREGTDWAEDSPRIVSMKTELLECLKPMEVQVTKSKEKGKGYHRMVLFCNKNLRLYNNIREFLGDLPELNLNSSGIEKKIYSPSKVVKLVETIHVKLIISRVGNYKVFYN